MNRPPNVLNRLLFHPLQAVAAFVLYSVFRLLPLAAASTVGGAVCRWIGPRLRISQRAVGNLSRAFPEKTTAEIDALLVGMWDNLGRTAAEYPHLSDIDVYAPNGRVEVIGAEYVDLLRDDGKPGIFISAHLGNWEIGSLGATQRGLPVDRVYRQANNPWVERLFRRGRRAIKGALIPKGSQGARELLRSLKNGNHIGMMADQKMNDGIAVPFFGRDAMTAPAMAQMALRFDCPIVAARVERLPGVRFRLTILPPLAFTPSGDHHADIAAMMLLVNKQLESWIRDTPEQWLWLHNRWPD